MTAHATKLVKNFIPTKKSLIFTHGPVDSALYDIVKPMIKISVEFTNFAYLFRYHKELLQSQAMEDLDQYNGDAEHDMWVDFYYHENTGELSELFDDSDLDAHVDNLNYWD